MLELNSSSADENVIEVEFPTEEHGEEAYQMESSKEWQRQISREAKASGGDGAADFRMRKWRAL